MKSDRTQPRDSPASLDLAGYGNLRRCWDNAFAITFAAHDEAGVPVFIMVAKPSHSRDLALAYEKAPALDCVVRPRHLFWRGQQACLVLEDDGTRPVGETLLVRTLGTGLTLMLGLGLAAALDRLHAIGVLHNNINAYSVWFDVATGNTKLADFLFARPLGTEFSDSQAPLRLADDVHYIAPEISGRVSHPSDYRSDLYSVGVLLYHAATGRLPFEETDTLALIHSHLSHTPKELRAIDPDVPEILSDLVMRLLAKAPAERYQTARGLELDLDVIFRQWRETGRISDIVLGRHDVDGPLPPPRLLYGRSHELEHLKAAFERAATGRAEIVTLTGPAGIGKSKLALQLQPIAEARGAFVATKFDQFRVNEPLLLIVSCFRPLIERLLTSEAEVQSRWRSRIAAAVGINGQAVIDLLPELQIVIGPQPALEHLPPHEGRNRLFRTLQSFLRVFSTQDHPLCMFLDDVQWSDPASLALLQAVMTEPDTRHMLVVVALRDEAETALPAAKILQRIATAGVHVEQIALTDLSVDDVTELLADTLEMERRSVVDLAQTIVQKTGGNPLSISQLLNYMHRNRLIRFDYESALWHWHLPTVAVQAITADVLELMTRKMLSLPEATTDILNFAACLGTIFEAERLALVTGRSRAEVLSALQRALYEGLVVLVDNSDTGRFAFIHDRVQQAAYTLAPESLRKVRRLGIGRSLLSSLTEEERKAVPFEVLDNLNEGCDLLESDFEREQVAVLNLRASHRARASAAHDAALDYTRRGISLLRPDHWDSQYDLTRDLYMARFECAYVTGNNEEANALFDAALSKLRTRDEKAAFFYVRILLSTGLEHSERAVALGMEALSMFGARIRDAPSRLRVFLEVAHVAYRLHGRSAPGLRHLPTLARQDVAAITRLLMSICPAAYFRSPELMAFAGLRIVAYSLRYGNGPASSFGYVLYGLISGAMLGRYKAGNAFGRLAIELAQQSGSRTQLCKIMMIYAGFVCFWREPLQVAVSIVERALELALDVGDVQYANYSILQVVFLNFAKGENVERVLAYCSARYGAVRRTHDTFAIANLQLRMQVMLALSDRLRPRSTLDRDGYDENASVVGFSEMGNLTTLCYYNILKSQLCYLFGEYEAAFAFSEEADKLIECVLGQITVADHYFFRGLAAAALLRRKPTRAGPLWRALKTSTIKMTKWSRNCGDNFAGRAFTLQAEVSALGLKGRRADELYDRAISQASESQCALVECVANELAGAHYLEKNRPQIARTYLLACATACRKWGAHGKLVLLQNTYSALLQDSDGAGARAARPRGEQSLVDLDTIARTSVELVSNAGSDRVIERLMYLTVESSGARHAILAVASNGGLVAEVLCSVEHGQARLRRAPDFEVTEVFSEAIARYVLRTGRPLILSDASVDARFKRCAYVKSYEPRSVLCMPLLRKDVALGVLYIENRQLAGAFGENRLQPLRLIAQQIATLLENAKLADRLSSSIDELEQALRKVELLERVRRHLSRFVPPSVQSLIESNPENPALETRQEEVSIMFLDVVGYTALSEHLDEGELNEIIETYFSNFADDIHEEGGEISEIAGDGLMIIFRDKDGPDHARRALRAALRVRYKTEELNSRLANRWSPVMISAGVHSGRVLLGAHKIDGPISARWTFTVTGFAANLAARIGKLASGNTILVSATTAAMAGDTFSMQDLGPQQFKGVSQPVGVLQVLGERQKASLGIGR